MKTDFIKDVPRGATVFLDGEKKKVSGTKQIHLVLGDAFMPTRVCLEDGELLGRMAVVNWDDFAYNFLRCQDRIG